MRPRSPGDPSGPTPRDNLLAINTTHLVRGMPDQGKGLVDSHGVPTPAPSRWIIQPVQRPLGKLKARGKKKKSYRRQHGIHVHGGLIGVSTRRPHPSKGMPEGKVMMRTVLREPALRDSSN